MNIYFKIYIFDGCQRKIYWYKNIKNGKRS